MGVQDVSFQFVGQDIPPGTPTTTLAVTPLPADIPAQTQVMVGYGSPNVTPIPTVVSADAKAGDNALQVGSFTPTQVIPTFTPCATMGVRHVPWKTGPTQTVTASGQTNAIPVGPSDHLNVGFTVTAISGAGASITFFVDTLGADGKWYQLWVSAALTAVNAQAGTSIGDGMVTQHMFTNNIRLRWTVAGTTPSVTFAGQVMGK